MLTISTIIGISLCGGKTMLLNIGDSFTNIWFGPSVQKSICAHRLGLEQVQSMHYTDWTRPQLASFTKLILEQVQRDRFAPPDLSHLNEIRSLYDCINLPKHLPHHTGATYHLSFKISTEPKRCIHCSNRFPTTLWSCMESGNMPEPMCV